MKSNIEIEHKFQLKPTISQVVKLAELLELPKYDKYAQLITQMYLWTNGQSEMRIRRIIDWHGTRNILGVKAKCTLGGRYEHEEEISRGFAIALRKEHSYKQVKKTRYCFRQVRCHPTDHWFKRFCATYLMSRQVWELDVYSDQNMGLFTIEVEVCDEDEILFVPKEINDLDIRLVRLEGEDLKRLSNRNIAKWIK